MITVGDLLKHVALEQIAKSQRGYYTPNKNPYIYFVIQDDNREKLERWKKLFGGMIDRNAGGPGSRYGDVQTEAGRMRGEWRWALEGHECYVFCKKILPYLAKHDKYRFDFCQACMMEYMTREDNPDERDDAETA